MGYRLSRIYTKTGDGGTTGLGNGSRVSKDDLRIECCGEIDELNCVVGLLVSCEPPSSIESFLTDVQHDLFDLGGELSIPGHSIVTEDRVRALERLLDDLNRELSPLREFILPGGIRAAAVCHLARAVCRRAERRLVALKSREPVNDAALKYVNRLSDLLFVMARWINKAEGREDVLWNRDRGSVG
jgi:cob(I)alamin adenosyltransferase